MTTTTGAGGVRDAVREATLARQRLSSPPARAQALDALAAIVEDHEREIVDLAMAETHLSEMRLRGELGRTTGQLRSFARALGDGSILEPTISLPVQEAGSVRAPDVRSVLHPLGPVAVFAASNFPLAFSVLGGDTASALAAGCPVVVKAHPGHPRLSDLVGGLVERAVGRGLVGVVHGQQEGLDLVAHPAIRAVGFTGSAAGARALQDRIDERADPIPLYGELGSLNPVVVMPAAAAQCGAELAAALVESFAQSAGQLCTKPGLVLVPDLEPLLGPLATALEAVGPATMLTPAIRERFADGLVDLRATVTGPVLNDRPPPEGEGVLPLAVVADGLDLTGPALEELFGPVTVLARYRTVDEALAVLGRLTGSLVGCVHAANDDDPTEVRRVHDALTEISGRVVHGGWPTGVAVVPAMNHGGPWPASTSPLHTSVGLNAARRFMRPVCYQDTPDALLPRSLQDANPWGLLRVVDGRQTDQAVVRAAAR